MGEPSASFAVVVVTAGLSPGPCRGAWARPRVARMGIVLGFDVSVDEPGCVGVFECPGDVEHDFDGFFFVEPGVFHRTA